MGKGREMGREKGEEWRGEEEGDEGHRSLISEHTTINSSPTASNLATALEVVM